MDECSAYVGLDVHKDTIAVAVAVPGSPARAGIGPTLVVGLAWLPGFPRPRGDRPDPGLSDVPTCAVHPHPYRAELPRAASGPER